MNNRIKHVLLMAALIIGILLHIAYMCYLRQDFALGGEWFIYCIVLFVAFCCEVTIYDD